MKLSLRNRILFPVLLVVTLAVALLSWSSYRNARNALVDNLSLQMKQLAENSASDIEEWINNRKLDLELLAGEKNLVQSAKNTPETAALRLETSAELVRTVKTYGCYDRINLVNDKGVAIASSDAQTVGKLDVSDRSYYKEAMTGKSVISDVVLSKTTGTPVFMIAVPVRDANRVSGVLFGAIGMENFKRLFIDSTKVLETGYLAMYDPQGIVIAHPDSTKIMKLDLSKFEWGKKILSLKNGIVNFSLNGQDKIAVFNTSKTLGWGVTVNITRAELLAPVRKIALNSLYFCLVAIALTAVVVYYVTRSIVTPVNRMVTALRESASQVSEGAGQISSASQSLASGASEQAASLEETTSALEEMAGMTRNNADSANTAKDLSNQTRQAAEHGEADMKQMAAAMDAIKGSSDDIAKIIKTIDEIAFQTNILALNAAVEAARAGEAGMGFAVVADEVRNLAHRSAEAAKETASKIEGAITRSGQGVEISQKVQSGLQAIVQKARKVDELIAEIAAASQEQHQGITQINQAVAQMDKITQSNAASAEESAGAAESLNHQSENLNGLINQLVRLSEGGEAPGHDAPPRHSAPSATPNAVKPKPETVAKTRTETKRPNNVDAQFVDN
jgi:methyl-accepting chemotaxis protein